MSPRPRAGSGIPAGRPARWRCAVSARPKAGCPSDPAACLRAHPSVRRITGGLGEAGALEALQTDRPDHVLIHDAARPFCSPDLIAAVLAPLAEVEGAFAALPVVDALWKAEGSKALIPVPREGLWRAQTPQAFRYAAILAAHANGDGDAADDVAIARQAGLAVRVVEGSEYNFKITLPRDLERAERMLSERR